MILLNGRYNHIYTGPPINPPNNYELGHSRSNHYSPFDWEDWPPSGLCFNNFTQLGLLLHGCTSLYTSLSHASLWGSSVTPRAHVAHYVRMIQPRASASRCDPSVPEWAFLLDCNSLEGLDSAAPDEESLTAFWGL